MNLTEEEFNIISKKSTYYDILVMAILEIYNTKGIDEKCRDRRIKFLLHNMDILEDEDLKMMSVYKID